MQQVEFLQLHQKAEIQKNLAWQYERSGDLQMSYEHITHANHLYETLQDMENYEYCRCKMLALSVHGFNKEEKIEDLKDMAFGYENVANHQRAGEVFVDLAGIYLRLSDYEGAEIAAEDALGQFRQQPGDNPAAGKAHHYLAACCFHKQAFEEGIEHLEQAMKMFRRHELTLELDEAVTFLCTHLKETGRSDKAFTYFMEHKTYLLERLEIRTKLEEFGVLHDMSETSSN